MFGFLKDKLKKALGKFSSDVEKETTIEKKEVIVEQKAQEKRTEVIQEKKDQGFLSKIFGKKEERIGSTKNKSKEEILEVDIKRGREEIITKDVVRPSIQAVKEQKIKDNVSDIKRGDVRDQSIKKIDNSFQPKESKIPIKEEIHNKEDNYIPQEVKSDIAQENKGAKPEEKKGFFSKITETFTKFHISEEKFEELFWELEVVLLENNVAVEVIEKIKNDLKHELMKDKVYRKGVEELILETLKKSIIELFDIEKIDLIGRIRSKKDKPYIITMIGVNGSGKTTSIAKLTQLMQDKGLSVVLAASDTFRAAAIQQLEEHAARLKTKLIKHDYHSDPAAVAYDAIEYAKAHSIDVVMIDTAGRLHSNTNLMKELDKIIRVCKPDIKIFVGESITGNDCIEQAKEFDKAVGIDAIILAKADVDEKGGAAISVSYVLQRPILYLGTGQSYNDLKEFDSQLIIDSLEL